MSEATPAAAESPFHLGERQVQAQLGVRDIEVWARRVVRPEMPRQHQDFYAALPFVVVAARDAQGRPWASMLAGDEGFMSSPDPRTLNMVVAPTPGDALDGALREGDIGLLGIELSTRRRNRVNGKLSRRGDVLSLSVEQSFGNCPQYIHERAWRRVVPRPEPAHRADALSPAQSDLVASADTFFIASGYRGDGEHPSFGMDASHRGGDPGFTHVESHRRLVFPDYAGNNHFNTIGNLVRDPRVGLLFVAFETGSTLQITGRARIIWEGAQRAEFPGARRLVVVDIDEVVEVKNALPLRWEGEGSSVRSLRVVDKTPESDGVTSFVLASRDGGRLPDFEPGQHLPLVLDTNTGQRVTRTYSLSSGPDDDNYRITVKREPHGLVSQFLHDEVDVGTILSARNPAGDFVLTHSSRPVVLLSAGVGLTPMVSMLRALVANGSERPVHYIHAARDERHHSLRHEVASLVERHPTSTLDVIYSAPGPRDTGHHHTGRLDVARLEELLLHDDADYFVCGPDGFMAAMVTALEARGVNPDDIHVETFGPKG